MLDLQLYIQSIYTNLVNGQMSKTLGGQCEGPYVELNTY